MSTYQAVGAVLAVLILAGGVTLAVVKAGDVLDTVVGVVFAVFGALLSVMFWPLAVLIGGAVGAKLWLQRREASR